MKTKRGRKRTSEMYFGPDEEEAVVKFLESRYIETVNFVTNKPVTIKHNLGEQIIVDINYVIKNEMAYGNESKFLTIEVTGFTISNVSENTVDITTNINIENAKVIVTNEIERNLVYNEWLKPTFDKMIESIIRKYKLHRKNETFKNLHDDTHSFLMTKMDKFDVSVGKKAYSYYGTICKNYVLGLRIKDDKSSKHTSTYENMSDIVNQMNTSSYTIDEEEFNMDIFIKRLIKGIHTELDDANQPPKKKLNDNERKVGYALIEILGNWETAFDIEGGPKYNKNSILETMRNYTNLSTKDIRLSMKRFKELYELLKQYGL